MSEYDGGFMYTSFVILNVPDTELKTVLSIKPPAETHNAHVLCTDSFSAAASINIPAGTIKYVTDNA